MRHAGRVAARMMRGILEEAADRARTAVHGYGPAGIGQRDGADSVRGHSALETTRYATRRQAVAQPRVAPRPVRRPADKA